MREYKLSGRRHFLVHSALNFFTNAIFKCWCPSEFELCRNVKRFISYIFVVTLVHFGDET
jgi:hypothetical protein